MVCTLLALAAVLRGAYSLRELHAYGSNPSAISNLELLIPLAMLGPEHVERSVKSHEHHRLSPKVEYVDESYSNIPAYEFTLDEGSYQVPNERASIPKEEAYGRSLYLTQLWAQAQNDDQQEPRDISHNSKHTACYDLAGQRFGEVPDVILTLCNELVDLLTGDCDCCGVPRSVPVPPLTRNLDRPSPTMPWFGPFRRQWIPLGDPDDVGVPRSRVFV